MPGRSFLICLFVLALAPHAFAQPNIVDISVDPPRLALVGPNVLHSLLVHGKTADGSLVDLTRQARYKIDNADLALVSERGVVTPLADGQTKVIIEAAGMAKSIALEIRDHARPRDFHFENDIVPILNRFACNSSGCHANPEGQNGFKLSVFGFDALADYTGMVKEGRGRRVFHAAPESSLILAKPSGGIAHGGGVRIRPGSPEYDTVKKWIEAGTPFGDPKTPGVASIRLEPSERLMAMKTQQQLRVIARYEDGREFDVSHHAKFQASTEGLVNVTPEGLVTVGTVPGEVAVMAHYMGCVDTFRALVPRAEKIAKYPAIPENNFIDTLVVRRLKQLHIVPSELADDSEFVRRVYLDVIGTLPTAAEAQKFLADKRDDKRSAVVDELLERPEFADYWALQWSDILRVDRQVLGQKRAYGMYRWIRESIARNRGYDAFVRDLLTAEGPLEEVGPASFFKVVTKPGEAASSLSQVFLGVRIACAECHHHPFDRWSQTDYYGMQAFFTPLSIKATARGDVLLSQPGPLTKHPRTGDIVQPHALGTKMPDEAPKGERRLVLADWMTSPTNPFFARNFANRVWAHFLGRGLIDPVDDVRDTNPPSNAELLTALAKHAVETKFDLKQMIRTITRSRTYQLSSKPNETNAKDNINFSRSLFRRVHAEVLLDMVSQTTGVPEQFNGVPADTRAIQLWDSKVSHYFLKLFGRPLRNSPCECERNHEPTVSQVLHLMNAPAMQAKLGHDRGTVARLVRTHKDDVLLLDELYLTFYSRRPDSAERETGLKHIRKDDRRQAVEDLAWTLMNSLEFVFNH